MCCGRYSWNINKGGKNEKCTSIYRTLFLNRNALNYPNINYSWSNRRDPYYTAWIFLSVFLGIGALLYFATIVSKLINKGKTQTLEEKRYAEYWNNVKVNIPK